MSFNDQIRSRSSGKKFDITPVAGTNEGGGPPCVGLAPSGLPLVCGWSVGLGTGTFAMCCCSVGYKSVGSQPALFLGGLEPFILQGVGNQSFVNGTVPNLGRIVTGQDSL